METKKVFELSRKFAGQATIIALLLTFMAVVMFSGLSPAIIDVVNTTSNLAGIDNTTTSVIQLILPMMALGILIGFIMYIAPGRREY